MHPKKTYVTGFMFSPCTGNVLLLQKTTPKWQAGMWNGIGGKIEPGETPIDAMVREFQEETTIETAPEEWEHVFTLESQFWEVTFFRSLSGKVYEWDGTSPTEETVQLWGIDSILSNPEKIANLEWIIPFLRDPHILGPVIMKHS